MGTCRILAGVLVTLLGLGSLAAFALLFLFGTNVPALLLVVVLLVALALLNAGGLMIEGYNE